MGFSGERVAFCHTSITDLGIGDEPCPAGAVRCADRQPAPARRAAERADLREGGPVKYGVPAATERPGHCRNCKDDLSRIV
jgi:hypothetical protein